MKDKQPKTQAEWIVLVKEQATSGLSQIEFCRQRNLIACRFSYYRKRYGNINPVDSVKTSSFMPVSINSNPTTITHDIKIQLPSGFHCQVPSTIAPERLKQIISVLLSC